LAADHHVLPRAFGPAPGSPSLLEQTLGLAAPLADPRLGLLAVTSWNEWGEDTQLEPTAPAPTSSGPIAQTLGYPYVSYGTLPLERLLAFEQRWETMPRAVRLAPPEAR